MSEVFLEFFQNFPKYFSIFYEIIILEICRNNSENFQKFFLKFFNIFLKNFDNISGTFQNISQSFTNNFRNYFSKFSEITSRKCQKYFSNPSKIFWNDFRNCAIQFSKFSKIFLKILWSNSRNSFTFAVVGTQSTFWTRTFSGTPKST